jgi:hypothetical protein
VLYRDRHDRGSDHPAHRELPLPARGQLLAERRNRGYTLYRAGSGALVARLRPTGQDDRVEVLNYALWKERWTKAGPFGRTVLPLDQALRFIASPRLYRKIALFHRLPWMWKTASFRKISCARSGVSLSRPMSPKVRQRSLTRDQ